ncbi:MAG: hypothetical protein ACYDG0_09465, partial [Vulcanimicrobiaceae bacterium]
MTLRVSGVAATLGVALLAALLAALSLAHGSLAFASFHGPLPMLQLDFGVSRLAVPFLAVLALLATAVALWSLRRGAPIDAALIGLFAGAMLLVLIAQSVASFFVAWEAMSLVS